jgi:hypothetical protein
MKVENEMSNNENYFRKVQRLARDANRTASGFLKEHKVGETISEYGQKAQQVVSQKYQELDLDRAVQPVLKTTMKTAIKTREFIAETATTVDGKLDLIEKIKGANKALGQGFIEPAKGYLNDTGVSSTVQQFGRSSIDQYGFAREAIKPYFPPENGRELLENTHRELTAITASVLQVTHSQARDWQAKVGRAVSAKFAAAAGTFSLFGLVSTFGTAGTGAAIAGLSGAAANSATLAAIGGVVGGGMAAGAMVLSGFGLLLGVGAYKLLSSTAREYENLHDVDKRIVDTASLLAAAIKEKLAKKDVVLTADEASQFLQTLQPFQRFLEDNQDDVCSRLDVKNAISYRHHAITDFKLVAIRDFKIFTQRQSTLSTEGIIGGVFYGLLSHTALDGTPEQVLVLEALRRSDGDLVNASEAELSEYLHAFSPQQMQGVANNVKGIYHELQFVEKYNEDNHDTYAVLYEATNHQGSDVMIKSKETDEVLEEYQLKATDNVSYVRAHQSRYESIDVKATSEVAERIEGVETSNFSNVEMTLKVDGTFEDLANNTISDRVINSAEISGLATAGLEAINILTGKSDMAEGGKRVVSTAVSASVATGITAFLFG